MNRAFVHITQLGATPPKDSLLIELAKFGEAARSVITGVRPPPGTLWGKLSFSPRCAGAISYSSSPSPRESLFEPENVGTNSVLIGVVNLLNDSFRSRHFDDLAAAYQIGNVDAKPASRAKQN